MKPFVVIFSLFFLFGCASKTQKIPGTNLDQKLFELNIVERQAPSLSFMQLEKEMHSLNKYIGSWPPKFSNDEERQLVYEKWLMLVSEAEAYKKVNPNTENAWYLLSELYRQGHNMDVKGSAEKAHGNLDLCLNSYEKSVPCNFSAAYFYLSVAKNYIDRAEKSLSILRAHFSPKKDAEVEAGYVFLYLYRQDVKLAKQQIEAYLEAFPNAPRAQMFRKIYDGMGDSIQVKKIDG